MKTNGKKEGRGKVLLVANSSFKLANFRSGLIGSLIDGGNDVIALTPVDKWTDDLSAYGCEVVDLPMDRHARSILGELSLFIRIFKAVSAARPDYILSFTIKCNVYCGLAAQILSVEFIPNITGRGRIGDSWAGRLLSSCLYIASLRTAKKIFVQNSNDKRIFSDLLLLKPSSIEILPGSGVDLSKFTSSKDERFFSENRALHFIYASRLLRSKGIIRFLNAARSMLDSGLDITVSIAGSFDEHSSDAISIDELDVYTKNLAIRYIGEVEDVRTIFSDADCLVLPTRYLEGTPRVILEAAAEGLAVITTNSPGCREAVIDGVTGYLAGHGEEREVLAAMKTYHLLGALRRLEMSVAARNHMERNYDESIVIGKYHCAMRER